MYLTFPVLEQLERLRYDDPTPYPDPMITHTTIDSYWIPNKNKTKSNLQIWKFAKTSNF